MSWRRVIYMRDEDGYTTRLMGLDSRDPHQIARDHGMTLLLPTHDELLLDLDSRWARRTFERRVRLVQRAGVELKYQHIWQSQHSHWWARRYHASIEFPRSLSDTERIAWQTALGSDPMRELLSMVCVEKQIPLPTVLFEAPNSGAPTTHDSVRAIILED